MPLRAVVLALMLATLSLAVPGRVGAQPAPTTQRIVVSVPDASSPTGTLTAYQRTGDQWHAVLGPTHADLGEIGVGAPADDVFRTPIGTFPLGQSFGRLPNPGTAMPYFQTTDEDWWDEEPESPTYNLHVHGEQSPSDDAENLYDSGVIYDYAVLIEHNRHRIPGRSAGIFLHVTDGDPTWGCVAIGHDEMRSVLNWLDPAAAPEITIGINAPAPE
ncbi:MAG: L,D-transpeptidase family protein [Mycobacterium sp.]